MDMHAGQCSPLDPDITVLWCNVHAVASGIFCFISQEDGSYSLRCDTLKPSLAYYGLAESPPSVALTCINRNTNNIEVHSAAQRHGSPQTSRERRNSMATI